MSTHRITGTHKNRQTQSKYEYDIRYVVSGRDVTWQGQVSRGGRHWALCGGGLELPEEDAGTGLGLSASEIVRHDVHRSIDGME